MSWAKYDVKYFSKDHNLEKEYNRKSNDQYYWSSRVDTMKVVRFFDEIELNQNDVAVESIIYVKI